MTAARALIRLAALWRKEALALLRDRHGLAALFLMPAIFILVMSMALRDAFVPGVPADLGYAIVDLDRSEASQALEGQLAGIDLLREFGTLDSEQTGREAVADGRIAFVLVVPRGFEHALGSAASAGHEAAGVRLLADPTVPLAVRNGFRQQVEAELTRLQLSTLLARIGRSLLIPELRDVAGKAPPLPVVVEAVRKPTLADGSESAAPLPSSVQQNVPAWLIFSMFFVVVPISAVFIAERQHGTLQRLATQQVSFGLILAGKLLPFFVVNQVQAVLMVLVGRYLVPLAGGEALTLPTGAASLLALWLMSAAVSVAALGPPDCQQRAQHRAGHRDRRCRQHPDGCDRRHHGAEIRHAVRHAAPDRPVADGMGAGRLSPRDVARRRHRRRPRPRRRTAILRPRGAGRRDPAEPARPARAPLTSQDERSQTCDQATDRRCL